MQFFKQRKFGRLIQQSLRCNLGLILNLSAGGMSVRCGRVPHGDIEVDIPGHPLPHPLRARVAWSRRSGLFKHDVGLQFIDVSPETARSLCAVASANRLTAAA